MKLNLRNPEHALAVAIALSITAQTEATSEKCLSIIQTFTRHLDDATVDSAQSLSVQLMNEIVPTLTSFL